MVVVELGSDVDVMEALLYHGEVVEVPTWHALPVEGTLQGSMWEVSDFSFVMKIPLSQEDLDFQCGPMLSRPWAENQFQERVCGKPLNPGETYKEWPYGHTERHKEGGSFSHTYMERYWPKYAGNAQHGVRGGINKGTRFAYGDLRDVVNLLAKQPTTRQAYLPVWFPEDTGAVHGGRVPCSLGYLFLMRDDRLNITYYIRSCDFFRHFTDDVYMTARLCQWVLDRLRGQVDHYWEDIQPGTLTMHIGSFHIFSAELSRLRRLHGQRKDLTRGIAHTSRKDGRSQEHLPKTIGRGSSGS